MHALLSSPVWNGIAGLCSLIGLVTVLGAFVGWIGELHRTVNAKLELDVKDAGGNVIIRLENTGESGCTILALFHSLSRMRTVDGLPPSRSLRPGGALVLEADAYGYDSVVIVVFVDHRRTNVAHAVLFDYMHHGVDSYWDGYRRLSWPWSLHRIRYKDGVLFPNARIRHRVIRLRGGDRPELRAAYNSIGRMKRGCMVNLYSR